MFIHPLSGWIVSPEPVVVAVYFDSSITYFTALVLAEQWGRRQLQVPTTSHPHLAMKAGADNSQDSQDEEPTRKTTGKVIVHLPATKRAFLYGTFIACHKRESMSSHKETISGSTWSYSPASVR